MHTQSVLDASTYGFHALFCLLAYAPTHVRCLQDLKDKIEKGYRIRMVLDNMPITTYDLAKVCFC